MLRKSPEFRENGKNHLRKEESASTAAYVALRKETGESANRRTTNNNGHKQTNVGLGSCNCIHEIQR